MKQCTECSRDFDTKYLICETCRKRQQRAKKKELTEAALNEIMKDAPVTKPPEIIKVPKELEPLAEEAGFEKLPILPADKMWWEKNKHMGEDWVNWVDEYSNECASCKKPFRTNLRLLKTCANCATV